MHLLTNRLPTMLAAIVVVTLLAACRNQPVIEMTAVGAPARLAVAGASSGTASITAAGQRVAVVWIAIRDEVASVVAAVSTDGGESFSAPVQVNDSAGDVRSGGDQGPRAAFTANGDLLVVWASRLDGASRIRRAQSRDGGRIFEPAVTVSGDSLTGARGWASIANAHGDDVHAAWLDGRDATARPARPATAAHEHVMRQDIYHAAWQPEGAMVETRVATGVCFCCKTSVAVAADGSTYVAWRHVYPTNLRDIAVARSTDGGKTFGEPVRVSEDQWQIAGCPEDGPGLAVDDHAIVHIVWPTIVGNAARKSVFHAASTDGGRSFTPRTLLATQGSHPNVASLGGRTIAAWDEDGPDGISRVSVTQLQNPASGTRRPSWVTGGGETASRPAVALTPQHAVVAWTFRSGQATEIHVQRLRFPD